MSETNGSVEASEATVLVEHAGEGVTIVRLNRPRNLNALTAELVGDLRETLWRLAADTTVRAIVLTGAGRGFCAGWDLNGYGTPRGWTDERPLQLNYAVQRELAALVVAIRELRTPVVVAVNGPATGGGMALALAGDVRIMARSASFAAAFVRVGLSGCDMGISWLLPRLVGAGCGFELMLTGRSVPADEAERIGLANRVVDDDSVLEEALTTARLITANSPWGVAMTKEVMWAQLEVASLRAGVELENRTQVLCTYTGDTAEAMAAFAERRPAQWS